ncbi:MAG: Site-specific recombinase, partial [Bradyrhizobium sp.]|nr:Site-specific recombinase [Bradyrhizobium sp.]
IIDDELWQAVKTRQSEIADKYVNVTEAIREAQSNRLNGFAPAEGAVFRVDPLRRLRWPLLAARPGPLCLFGACY